MRDPPPMLQALIAASNKALPPSTTDSSLTQQEAASAPAIKDVPQDFAGLVAFAAQECIENLTASEKTDELPVQSGEKTDELPAQAQSGELDWDFDEEDDDDGTIAQEDTRTLSSIVESSKNLQRTLFENIFGQDHAVTAFVSGYFQSELLTLTNTNRNKPLATFLFAGPPGVGKTFLAEQAAEGLGLPFMRFDMSEYVDKEANIEFCGSDKVYKNGKAGNVTSFVAEHPRCVLLFDEIEKAHLNVIYLFLQMLDAGRLRDNSTDEEVSFANAIVIFTTNAGKKLYEDDEIVSLSSLSRKAILSALGSEKNPVTGEAMFPAAICSRFASGNVVMFDRLGADNLLKIVQGEFNKVVRPFKEKTGVDVQIHPNVAYSLLYAEGGNVDARMVRGRSGAFLYQELYELFRLSSSQKIGADISKIQTVRFDVCLPTAKQVRALFEKTKCAEVLAFGSPRRFTGYGKGANGLKIHFTQNLQSAKEILAKQDISVILCDVTTGLRGGRKDVLNLEDVDSIGADFFYWAAQNAHQPLYVMQREELVSEEERVSFTGKGASGVITLGKDKARAFETLLRVCGEAHQQSKLLQLARANKVLSFRTAQKVEDDGLTAVINLYDFKLAVAPDAGDGKNMLSGVSKPNVRFSDVIGAEDAKDELKYFVKYLKDPATFARSGLRPPKGVLLYGPPGTGKTLLAKAMAGESDVTFIAAEGNEFLKKYVGEGSAKVHELFSLARKYAPSVLFIDEIDAVGKDRTGQDANNSADVLTAFLTEMDGVKTKGDRPVFVLAATNYDVDQTSSRRLDPALLRRFDRRILVDLPSKAEREQYLKLRFGANPCVQVTPDGLENVAVRSANMSLADLESVVELALRMAVRTENHVVDDMLFEEAFETYSNGEVRAWAVSELTRTARHEAGHAFVLWHSGETPAYLTVVARGSHGGYMQGAAQEDKGTYTKKELLTRIRTALGGRAAELVYYGDEDGVSTGAAADLGSATEVAKAMVCAYGMDEETGLASVDTALLSVSSQPMKRVNEILEKELQNAKAILQENRAAVDALVTTLMEKNHLRGKEIDALLSAHAKGAKQ